jgi:hypothetical protein
MLGITLTLFTFVMDVFKDMFTYAVFKQANNKETNILSLFLAYVHIHCNLVGSEM